MPLSESLKRMIRELREDRMMRRTMYYNRHTLDDYKRVYGGKSIEELITYVAMRDADIEHYKERFLELASEYSEIETNVVSYRDLTEKEREVRSLYTMKEQAIKCDRCGKLENIDFPDVAHDAYNEFHKVLCQDCLIERISGGPFNKHILRYREIYEKHHLLK